MSKCIHGEPSHNCGICEELHALENRVENRDTIIAALRAEVKAARIFGSSWPLGIGIIFARQQWEDAMQATDALGALNEDNKR